MNTNPRVSLFSGCNFLSLALLESLLSKNCYVNVISDDVKNWKSKVLPLAGNKHFSILERKSHNEIPSTYSIVVLGFTQEDPYEELAKLIKANLKAETKTLILLPFEKYSFEESSHFNLSSNLGVIYLGDLIGPRMDLGVNLLISRTLSDIYFKRKLNLAVGEIFYPTFVNDAAKTICRWLFSFGPYGKETFLYGSQVSSTDFWKENSALVGDVKLSYDEEGLPRPYPKGSEIKELGTNLKLLLTETYKWLTQVPPKRIVNFANFNKSNIPKKKRTYPPYLRPVIITTVLVLLFPFILVLISGGMFFFSYKQFVSGNDSNAQNIILVAKTLSVISAEESRGLTYIPLLGRVYKETRFAGIVGEHAADMAVSAFPLVRSSSDLVNKILGNIVYDPTIDSAIIRENLDSLYRDISLFQVDAIDSAGQGSYGAKLLIKRVDLDKFKNLTFQMENLTQNLPAILGKGQSKSYLVLFQNNMELRPTGGFIGSFGILTFDEGRISDLTINDVYSADGQLNGHVEPPAPIKTYLGEANWWLRDSNWDPDFPTSANRAEWFLDKEMGRTVDGVFALDLQPIKDILKLTGPVFLADFNLDITSDNLYEKTQAEVQENFFPGTHQKASFLTALSRSLLTEISKLGTAQKLGILKSFYSDLEGRSIQAFIHDDSSQSAISSAGWDGAVDIPDCGQGCYPDIVGTVEANVGDNKANYFIERSENFSVSLSRSGIQRKLDLVLKNDANPALGPSGTYKVYARLLSDINSQLVSVKTMTGETITDIPSDITKLKNRNETGVYVEVLAGQTKTIEFVWRTSIPSNTVFDKYGLYLRKQAGVAATPASLTVNGTNVYNGLLAGDYFNRLDW